MNPPGIQIALEDSIMTAAACIKPEQQRVTVMPETETAYQRHMAIVRATLNQEMSHEGRTWEASTHRQRFQILKLNNSLEREEIERVFVLDWVDLPARYQDSYKKIIQQFVAYVVKHGWAK